MLLVMVHIVAAAGCNGPESQPKAGPPPAAFSALFPADSLEGWSISDWSDLQTPQRVAGAAWKAEGDVLYGLGRRTWIFSEAEYGDFVLTFEVKISPGANGGMGLRFPPEGDPAYKGLEVQIVDHEVYYRGRSRPEQRTGSIYDEIAPTRDAPSPIDQWSTWQITARGSRVTVVIDGEQLLDADLSKETKARQQKGPSLAERPTRGRIGFQNLKGLIAFRKLRIKAL
jgi:hypothetical protein